MLLSIDFFSSLRQRLGFPFCGDSTKRGYFGFFVKRVNLSYLGKEIERTKLLKTNIFTFLWFVKRMYRSYFGYAK